MKTFGRLLGTVLLGSACSEEPIWWTDVDPDFEWRGAHVTISGYDREPFEACGESLRATDDQVAAIIDFHGTNAPVRVDYAWMSQSAWEEFQPCTVGTACTDRGRPVTRQLVHAHELAHAVSWDMMGTASSCISVLEEGLATYFGAANPTVFKQFAFTTSIEEILDLKASESLRLPGKDYQHAGHFVSFLIEDHGIEAVRGLCDVLPFNADLDDWDSATRSVLDLPLADLLADYSTYPICQHHAYRAKLTECAGEPDVIVNSNDGEETSFSLRLACDEPDAIGERDGMVTIVKRVYAPRPLWYDVGIEGNEDVSLVLEQCAPCSEEPHVGEVEYPLRPADSPACVWVYSPGECHRALAGTHAFIFSLPADQEREVTVTIRATSMELD